MQQGSSLSDALDKEKRYFPVLFLSLVKLGESTGHISEIFGELEKYYQLEFNLRRQFRSQCLRSLRHLGGCLVLDRGLLVPGSSQH